MCPMDLLGIRISEILGQSTVGKVLLNHLIYVICYYIQPERWLRIRKLEAQGPSNSYF